MPLDSISTGWVSVSSSKGSEFQPLWLAESGLLNGILVGELEESTLMNKTHKPVTQGAHRQVGGQDVKLKGEICHYKYW